MECKCDVKLTLFFFCITKVTEEQPDYENIINRKFLNTQCNCDKNVFVIWVVFFPVVSTDATYFTMCHGSSNRNCRSYICVSIESA